MGTRLAETGVLLTSNFASTQSKAFDTIAATLLNNKLYNKKACLSWVQKYLCIFFQLTSVNFMIPGWFCGSAFFCTPMVLSLLGRITVIIEQRILFGRGR